MGTQIMMAENLSIFKKLDGNRDIDVSHVRALAHSIQGSNLLAIKPIVVNKNMQVIDGQHRLEAARMLDVPVYYVILDEFDHEDLCRVNTHQKNWSLDDYINYNIEVKGNVHYQIIRSISQKFRLSIIVVCTLTMDDHYSYYGEVIRKGILKIEKSFPEISQIIDRYVEIRRICEFHKVQPIRIFNTGHLARAYRYITNSPNFDWERLRNKVNIHWAKIGLRTTIQGYLDMLLDIYNVRAQDKLTIDIKKSNFNDKSSNEGR